MGLGKKIDKWIIGAVMGKKYVIEYELSQESEKTAKKKGKDGLKEFLELGVDELKQDIGGITKSVKAQKGFFGKKKKEENEEDEAW